MCTVLLWLTWRTFTNTYFTTVCTKLHCCPCILFNAGFLNTLLHTKTHTQPCIHVLLACITLTLSPSLTLYLDTPFNDKTSSLLQHVSHTWVLIGTSGMCSLTQQKSYLCTLGFVVLFFLFTPLFWILFRQCIHNCLLSVKSNGNF